MPDSPESEIKAPRSDDGGSIRIVEPWPLIRPVSNDECWESMSEGDITMLGMDRSTWESHFDGNPCQSPEKRIPRAE
jgi:hypothetical protein